MHDTLRSSTSSRLRLHHHPFSSNARRAVLVIHHLGLSVELVLVENLLDPEQRKKLVLLNPNAKIPVLEHGLFVLWESNAIMGYLADQVPGQTLYPTDLQARADVNRWLFWSAQHWSPALGVLTWERWMKGLFGFGAADAAESARGEREVQAFAPVLEQQLATGAPWVTGDVLTIADFSLATPLMRMREARLPLDGYPRLQEWFRRVSELEAWARSEPAADPAAHDASEAR
ncbi:MAG TPA: glutathione S-transferase family protein, partial [Polyangiaceae bacterium]|nr:glutathione S-transferase family protein [Polyangiaceae bacterium]